MSGLAANIDLKKVMGDKPNTAIGSFKLGPQVNIGAIAPVKQDEQPKVFPVEQSKKQDDEFTIKRKR